MARPSEEKLNIEIQRMKLLQEKQAEMRAHLKKEMRVRKGGKAAVHLPGEENHKRQMAVFLKLGIPNISYQEIADRIGEHRHVVRKWFAEEPAVKEFYDWALLNLKEGALAYLETLGFEAAETLAILMRFGSEKYMFEAANSILDRVGVPKVSRSEAEVENKKSHEWSDREQLVAEIRELPEDQQEAAIEALEKFEQLLTEHSRVENNEEIEQTPDDGFDQDDLDGD